jgi:hypothetical protein
MAIPLLQELVDGISYRIIMSTIDKPKTVFEIATENGLALSSTYKRIKELHMIGALSAKTITLDGRCKKVDYFRSTIKSIEFNISRDHILLRFEKNH